MHKHLQLLQSLDINRLFLLQN